MKKLLIALLMTCVTTLFAAAAQAPVIKPNASPYKEGVQYKVLPPEMRALPTAKAALDAVPPNHVEVIAFFSYGCPVCNRMEPEVEKWYESKKNLNIITFYDVPVDWAHPGWDNLARAYYIAEGAKVLAKAHPAIFKAVHQQGMKFPTKESLQEFFLTQVGMSRDQFNSLYDSFSVRRHLKQAELLREEYNIMSIPAFVINGKYYVDVQTAGSVSQTIDVVNYLVNKESFTQGEEEIKFDNAIVDVKPAPAEAPIVPSTAK